MIGYVEAPITWGLVRGMARRAGLDVPRAVIDGWITRAEEFMSPRYRLSEAEHRARVAAWG